MAESTDASKLAAGVAAVAAGGIGVGIRVGAGAGLGVGDGVVTGASILGVGAGSAGAGARPGVPRTAAGSLVCTGAGMGLLAHAANMLNANNKTRR